MRSARSASRLFCEACWWWPPRWLVVAKAWPRLPSLMAVVERAEREVVVEVGVPLDGGQLRSATTQEKELGGWVCSYRTGLRREYQGQRAQAEGR